MLAILSRFYYHKKDMPHEQHDHSQPTHTAKCNDCPYVAEVHAHDDDSAVDALSDDLAGHNLTAHGQQTNPKTIKDPVRDKMVTL